MDGGGREAPAVLLQVVEVGQGDHGGSDGGPYIASLPIDFFLKIINKSCQPTMITGIPSLSVIALLATEIRAI